MGVLDRNGRSQWVNVIAVVAILTEAAVAIAWVNPSVVPKVDFKPNIEFDALAAGPTLRPRITPTPVIVVTDTPVPTSVPKPSITPPPCAFGDLPAKHGTLDDWASTLLDTTYGLTAAYVPPDLVPVSQAGVAGSAQVRAFLVDDLRALAKAGASQGLPITAASAYRSYADQDKTYKDIEATYGTEYANKAAARAGHSEHQLGTTIDFSGAEAWLAGNAWKFGFIKSFPQDSSPDLTCFQPEPWHYRYYGREKAAIIQASGLSPREWLWAYEP
jgi:zinc D-Ala-D-Ala carboxypeptidase